MDNPEVEKQSMLASFKLIKGNARVMTLAEPLFAIPLMMVTPFVTLYMYNLGVSDRQIGLLASVVLLMQAITALLGGPLTDKLGRRLTVALADVISWSIPSLIWMFAQNFWWFLAAAIIHGTLGIVLNSWQWLFAEDADKKQLVAVYNCIHIISLLCIFFVPLSGLLMNRVGVVTGTRWLYLLMFIMMTTKFIVTYIFTKETKQGKIKIEEMKNQSVLALTFKLGEVFRLIWHTPGTVVTIIFAIMLSVSGIAIGNFFFLYANRSLGVPESWIVIFPMIRAVIATTFLFAVQHRIQVNAYRIPMLAGLAFYVVSHAALLLAPQAVNGVPIMMSYGFVIGFVIFEALALALLSPRASSLIILNIEESQRMRISSVITLLMLGISAPFGFFIGTLSEFNPIMPFVFNIGLLAVMFVFVFCKIKNVYGDE